MPEIVSSKLIRKRRPKWRRADKRREVAEHLYINSNYEFPPDHVSDGRLLHLYKQLNKELLTDFKADTTIEEELRFYSALTQHLTEGRPLQTNLTSLSNPSNTQECDGCPFSSPSTFHHYSTSSSLLRVFRNGHEIVYQNSTFSATSFSITAICITSYFSFLSMM